MIEISKTGIDSIPVIQQITYTTWPVAYGEILSSGQLNYMLKMMYSTEALLQQISNGHQFILAVENGTPLAFAAYSPKNNNDFSIYKLHKIYILPDQQGKGIGRLLIDFICKEVAPATALQLNVNRHNKALQFYQKLGFKIIAEEDIDIGNGYFMNDYVMQLDLKCPFVL